MIASLEKNLAKGGIRGALRSRLKLNSCRQGVCLKSCFVGRSLNPFRDGMLLEAVRPVL